MLTFCTAKQCTICRAASLHKFWDFSHMTKIRDKKYLKDLGNRLRDMRIKRSISIRELSYGADISRSQINSIEKGDINPTICTLKVIADALEVQVKDLLDF